MAYTLLNDGATHTSNGSGDGPFRVVKSGGGGVTSLTVAAGAVITGVAFTGTVSDGLMSPGVNSQECDLTVTGGSITGGADNGSLPLPPVWPGLGVMFFRGNLSISGGTIVGGASDVTGYAAVLVGDPASLSISGVTATGGSCSAADGAGGNGLYLDLYDPAGSFVIGGGDWHGGDGDANGGHALYLATAGALTVNGGTWQGGVGTDMAAGVGGDGAYLILTGSAASFTFTNGQLFDGTGGLSVGNAITVYTEGAATVLITGGQVNGTASLYLDTGATFTVTGSGLGYSGGIINGTVGGVPQSITVIDLSSGSPGYTVSGGGASITLTGN